MFHGITELETGFFFLFFLSKGEFELVHGMPLLYFFNIMCLGFYLLGSWNYDLLSFHLFHFIIINFIFEICEQYELFIFKQYNLKLIHNCRILKRNTKNHPSFFVSILTLSFLSSLRGSFYFSYLVAGDCFLIEVVSFCCWEELIELLPLVVDVINCCPTNFFSPGSLK